MKNPFVLRTALSPLLLMIAACGQDGTETAPAVEEPGGKPGLPCMGRGMAARTPSPPGARVFFITPANGEVVSGRVRTEFGLTGMTVLAAGDDRPGSGHHHLIIDSELPPFGLPIPKDDNHVHFGDASTEAELDLAPGQHTLQLLFADHLHIPHDPPVFSEQITITIE